MNRFKTIIVTFLLMQLFSSIYAQIPAYPYHAVNKKVIILQGNIYWDWSSKIKDNLEKMQSTRPYVDGLAFHVGPQYEQATYGFNNEVWTESSLRFDDLKTIAGKWTTFTDNFILIKAHARNTDPDFFNDELWSQIIKNTELLGKAVKTGGCKGNMFDPEFYSEEETYSPWWYSKSKKFTPPYVERGISFKEACAKARQRGKEYVQALQVYMPDITILTTFLHSGTWCYCLDDITTIAGTNYALLASFADGMFEGLNPGATIIDGNEPSYYIDDTRKFVENTDQTDYKFCRFDGPKSLCDPAILKKWHSQGQVAMAPYLENCYNRYTPNPWSTPDYQSKWMTHNVYNSLLTTDKYVWIYIERMDFWTGENAPAGVDVYSDIKTAVDKFRNGEALGYEMYKPDSIYKYDGDKQATYLPSPKIELTTSTKKLPGNITIKANIEKGTSISRVEFFVNSTKIGEDLTAPYSVQEQFTKSDYLIFARVFTTNGHHFTSGPLVLKKRK